ncbi:hypothetical protein SSP35_15_00780 [Streptomyces sp. NBRC 110611]|nr:hypothetical protein SSP35_15_00780 [Streptomyces sp. NBRC 110611]
MTTKPCCRCGVYRPRSEFYALSNAPDGLRYDCKPCVRASMRAYYWQHREQILVGRRARYHAARDAA